MAKYMEQLISALENSWAKNASGVHEGAADALRRYKESKQAEEKTKLLSVVAKDPAMRAHFMKKLAEATAEKAQAEYDLMEMANIKHDKPDIADLDMGKLLQGKTEFRDPSHRNNTMSQDMREIHDPYMDPSIKIYGAPEKPHDPVKHALAGEEELNPQTGKWEDTSPMTAAMRKQVRNEIIDFLKNKE